MNRFFVFAIKWAIYYVVRALNIISGLNDQGVDWKTIYLNFSSIFGDFFF